MLISRNNYINKCLSLVNSYPCLAIIGPRQCGKTTFAKQTFPDYEYIDLELPSDLAKIENDPELFLSSRTQPIVIDEAQRLPELFPVLRALIDKDRKRFGQFILLGSASFSLQKSINESLSGRVGFLDFNPFHINEVHAKFSLNSFWLKGGFLDALINEDTNTLNFEWFEFYTRTLIERDLPSLGIDINQRQFRLLWKMASHFHGEVLNKNKIATSLGVSPHTVDRYLFILEQSFTLRLLPPYFANIKKRLIKSPKLYFRDSGMFHYFTELKTYENLISSPQLGSSFEGLVIEQILQLLSPDWKPYFFRTSDGIEVDLVLASGNQLVPVEIKSKLSASKKDYASLEKVLKILNQPKGFLITLGNDSYPLSEKVECIGIHHWANNSCYSFWEKIK